MTSTTTNYSFILYNKTTDLSALFSAYRNDMAGIAAGTNMVEIDANLKIIEDKLAFERQGGATGTDWGENPGTTNSTPTQIYVQFGSAQTDTPTGTKQITFPVAFTQKPIVLVSANGFADNDLVNYYSEVHGVTTTGFYGHIKRVILSAAAIDETTPSTWTAEIEEISGILNWIAIGTV